MLTKPRDPLKTSPTSLYTQRRRKISPLMLIGISVPVLIALLAAGYWVVLPRVGSHAANAVNMDCTLTVPANPLSAQGLATPYQLAATNAANGACNEANANQGAFVQGAIYDPAAGTISIYNPLVIDQGTQPLVAPTPPTLPANAVVGIWFGFNGNNLTLKGAGNSLRQGRCVNGLNQSVFGQFAYCNAPAFFAAAQQGIAAGQLKVPALATANDGQPCMTTRDFGMIDMDQSDNVPTQYLTNANGQTAQLTAANMAAQANATKLGNPSDNALLDRFLDPTLGCQPFMAPDIADNNNMVPALPLNELMAAADQQAPIALVPITDPMVLNNNNASLAKTNLYRRGVNQTPAANDQDANGTTYCQNFLNTGLPRLQLDMPMTLKAASPAADTANSLFTFLANRFMQSYTALGCQNLLNKPNPITVQMDGNGVVISATINGQAAGAGNGAAAAQVTVNGTAATFNNGTAQATINKMPATLTLNGTALTVTDGAANAQQQQPAQNGQAQQQPAQAQQQPAQAQQQMAKNCKAIKNKKARKACQQQQGQGQGQGAAAAIASVTVNNAALTFANGQAAATINNAPATVALNNGAVTITDGNGAQNNGGAQNANAGQITANGTAVTLANNTAQATINANAATISVNGAAVTITDGAANAQNNGNQNNAAQAQQGQGAVAATAITSVTVNGAALTFANGQATGTVNNAPATFALNNGNLTITDGAAQNNGGQNNGGQTPAAPAAPAANGTPAGNGQAPAATATTPAAN